MELKAILNKPFEDKEKADFIVEQNHQNGYEIKETDEALEAWGKTNEELLLQAKEKKQIENTARANQAIQNGFVVFKEAQFETNAQTVGDLTATMLLMQASGLETYTWLSKDDKEVDLTVEDFGILGGLIADFKGNIWQNKYLQYKISIEQAETVEEVNAIIINYGDEEDEEQDTDIQGNSENTENIS